MENEEKEDLLIEVTESESDLSEKENDCYIEGRIREFMDREKQPRKLKRKTLIFIFACLLTFLSCCIILITFPMYIQYSERSGIESYSKLVVLSFVNAMLFTIIHAVIYVLAVCTQKKISGLQFHLCLPKVLKICILMSTGSILMFWLIDGHYVSCHLQDPLKGCALVFSLLSYFMFSHKKMSMERMFCTITVILGVFVTVDYGICDRFRCYGNDYTSQTLPTDGSPIMHFIYVILYILSLGLWVVNFTYLENSCYVFHSSTSDMSVVTRASADSPQNKPSASGLAFICRDKDAAAAGLEAASMYRSNICRDVTPLSTTITSVATNAGPSLDLISASVPPPLAGFPLTSTPNESLVSWQPWLHWRSYSVLLWYSWICLLLVLALCWLPTLPFINSRLKDKLLIDVAEDAWFSLTCHTGHASTPVCDRLVPTSAILVTSYTALMIGVMLVLSYARSAIIVFCVLMNALPVASLWWSLWRIDFHSEDVLVFQPEVTGEAVCAMLGFPIMGIGTFLLVKSHVREFNLL